MESSSSDVSSNAMASSGSDVSPNAMTSSKEALFRQIALLAEQFAASSEMLTVLGDETRQHLILEMMKMGKCNGVRVGEITEKTNLSRPAVSHHLQILKKAGIIKVRKEGTKNYYFFDPEMEAFGNLVSTLQLAMDVAGALLDSRGTS